MKLKNLFVIFVAATGLTFINGCSGSDSSDGGGGTGGNVGGAETDTNTYSGPGSFWEAEFNGDGTATFRFAEDKETFDGGDITTIEVDITAENSGFVDLEVTSVDPEPEGDDGPEVGATAQGILFKGFAFLLKPSDGEEIIPMIIAGTCPSDGFVANWFMGQDGDEPNDMSDPESEAFGTFSFDAGDNTAEIEDYALTEGFPSPGNGSTLSVTCEDGIALIEEEGELQATMWLTQGGAVVQTQDGKAILATEEQSAELSDMEGIHSCLVFNGGDDSRVFPAQLDCAADGDNTACTGAEFEDISAGTVNEDSVDIVFDSANDLNDGIITGTIEGLNIACGVNTEQSVMTCAGRDPGEGTNAFLLLCALGAGN